MLIIETEPTIGISTMTELKDSIREKLVNDIIEDLNLHSSNKENVETPDNLIRNGTVEGKDKEIDTEEPILNIKQENNQLEVGSGIENVHDLNNIEKDTNTDGCTHEEKEVESQHEIDLNSRSLTNNNDDTHIEPLNELKHILKKEIDDSIIQEQNEKENVNVPVVGALEQNDKVVHVEEIKRAESVSTVELSESNDSHDNRDASNTNVDVSEKSDESEMDVIEVNKQQENSTSLNETELVSTSNNLAVNEAELSNTIDKEPELKTPDKDESNEVKCMDTVIIDDKDNDGLAEKNECMEIDDVEENPKETNVSTIIDCEDNSEAIENPIAGETPSGTIAVSKDAVVVVEEDEKEKNAENSTSTQMSESNKINQSLIRRNSSICRLSNNLDILSDDDDDETAKDAAPETDTPIESNKAETVVADKQCINIEDDDDIMLIEEDIPSKEVENKNETVKETLPEPEKPVDNTNYESTNVDEETGENKSSFMESIELVSNKNDKETISPVTVPPEGIQTNEKAVEPDVKLSEIEKPLLPENVLSLSKKKLSDMTREDLEEFCILKIVESIMDRSQLSDIKAKLSSMTQNFNEYRKKANALAKQNRDLQVVLKSVQEEQKKLNETYNVITPLKITRSVGMQIHMPDKITLKRKNSNAQNTRSVKTPNQNLTRAQKLGPNQIIPVPKLVPASNTTLKSPTVNVPNTPNNVVRVPNTLSNIVKISPVQKVAEKRPFSKTQAVTVDLTDDEPPAKMVQRTSPAPPVRVIPSQNLMATPRQHTPLGQMVNNQRKVFIPIGSQTGQNLRPGHNIMLKTVSPNGPRLRGPGPNIIRSPNQGRVRTGPVNRHPAPLPDATKQYQPPNWKALPPAPDLKLSKVDNGIVISWKIDGYQEDLFEQIASYQLYAYQETNSPPSTSLWKKIGDVAALPLPMACTLTQFTAGFKYFFAVRAVDVRSRIGPFSLPGSILLLKTM